jgi:hypothetical protein
VQKQDATEGLEDYEDLFRLVKGGKASKTDWWKRLAVRNRQLRVPHKISVKEVLNDGKPGWRY